MHQDAEDLVSVHSTHAQVVKKSFKHQTLSLHAGNHFRIAAVDGRQSESANHRDGHCVDDDEDEHSGQK